MFSTVSVGRVDPFQGRNQIWLLHSNPTVSCTMDGLMQVKQGMFITIRYLPLTCLQSSSSARSIHAAGSAGSMSRRAQSFIKAILPLRFSQIFE